MTKHYAFLFLFSGAVLFSGCGMKKNTPEPSPTSTPIVQNNEHNHMQMAQITTEKEFVAQMIPHHNEAIETSILIATQTADLDLKAFAKNVAVVQSKEVEQLETWEKEWFGNTPSNATYTPMMGDLHDLSSPELDTAYVKGMIVHHEAAIMMANQVLALSPRTEVEALANSIISTQQAEIEMLKGWLEAHP